MSREGYQMQREIPEQVAMDLLSVPPLIFRLLRRKLIKTTLEEIDVDVEIQHRNLLFTG